MAAVFSALPDGKMRIRKPDGLLELDVVKSTPKAPGIKDHPPDDPDKAVGYASVFSNLWIQAEGSKYKSADGKKLFVGVGSLSNIADSGMAVEEGRAAIYQLDLADGTGRVDGGYHHLAQCETGVGFRQWVTRSPLPL